MKNSRNDTWPKSFKEFTEALETPGSAVRRYLPLSEKQSLATLGACAAGYLMMPLLSPWFLLAGLSAFALRRSVIKKDLEKSKNGIFYLGVQDPGREAMWMSSYEIRRHMLVLGSTHSGITESMLGWSENALRWNSGFLYVCGKGDIALYAKIYELARRHGRQDDVVVLNFMSEASGEASWPGNAASNTYNPFRHGTGQALARMLASLDSQDDPLKAAQTSAMLEGLMGALAWRRDTKGVAIDASVIRDAMGFGSYAALAERNEIQRMPEDVRAGLSRHLESLPGYDRDRGNRQPQAAVDQHLSLTFRIERIIDNMCKSFPHIFLGKDSEIDMDEVLLRRRILVVLLPNLEKSPESVALAKVVVADLHASMSRLLSHTISGTWDEVVNSRPTNSPSPYLTIFDDVQCYMNETLGLVSAQARSLGLGMIFGSPGMAELRADHTKTADTIVGNTYTKLFMRTEHDHLAEIEFELLEYGIGKQMPGHFVMTRSGNVTKGMAPYPGIHPARNSVITLNQTLGLSDRSGEGVAP